MAKSEYKTLGFHTTPEMYDEIRCLAERDRRTVSAYLRLFVEKYLPTEIATQPDNGKDQLAESAD